MNTRKRVLKEVRALFWPWFIVTAAGLLPLVSSGSAVSHLKNSQSYGLWLASQLPATFSRLAFYIGLPLLAAFSLGNDFDDGTFSLLLSQPIDRMQLWREKFGTTIVAVLTAALAFVGGWKVSMGEPSLAVSWLLLTVPAAMFCTLIARSSVGGIILDLGLVVVALTAWANLAGGLFGSALDVVAAFCYGTLMLWLGRRTLARFQDTAGMGGNLLVAGPRMTPASAATGLLRCRPRGESLNLIRKELRLLRPLWLITAVFAVGWIGMHVTIRFMHQADHGQTVLTDGASVVRMLLMAGVFVPLALILAGSLSLGEERSSGTQTWHMILPVSAGRQWFIKLAMATLAGLLCGLLVPALIWAGGQWILGLPLDIPGGKDAMNSAFLLMLAVWLLSFTSFWCACVRKGTLPAALWVFPVVGAIMFSTEIGAGVAQELIRTHWLLQRPIGFILLVAPTLLLALTQSYWMFRNPPRDSTLSLIRFLLPLVAVAFASSFFFLCILIYSKRIARIGSIRLARCAGIRPAAAATALNRKIMEIAVHGSVPWTP